MDAITTLSTTLQGLRYAKDAVGLLLKQKIDEVAREKISDALSKLGETYDKLFDMREALFSLQNDNEALKRKLADYEKWDEKIAEYELTNTAGGALVYSYKGEPKHYACPRCASSKREIQFLQDAQTPHTGHFSCPGCDINYSINPRKSPPSSSPSFY